MNSSEHDTMRSNEYDDLDYVKDYCKTHGEDRKDENVEHAIPALAINSKGPCKDSGGASEGRSGTGNEKEGRSPVKDGIGRSSSTSTLKVEGKRGISNIVNASSSSVDGKSLQSAVSSHSVISTHSVVSSHSVASTHSAASASSKESASKAKPSVYERSLVVGSKSKQPSDKKPQIKSASDVDEASTDEEFDMNNIQAIRSKREREKKDRDSKRIQIKRFVLNDRFADQEKKEVPPNDPEDENHKEDGDKATDKDSQARDDADKADGEKAAGKDSQCIAINLEKDDDTKIKQVTGLASIALKQCVTEASGLPENRFILGQEISLMPLSDVVEVSSFGTRHLYDYLKRKCSSCGFSMNWVTVQNSVFTCYHHKKHKKTDKTPPESLKDVFVDPIDPNVYYEPKYTFDFSTTRMYLSKGFSYKYWLCCYRFTDPANFVDITDSQVHNVIKARKGYVVEVFNGNELESVFISDLDFVFVHESQLYYFRANTIENLLKWIIVFHMRKRSGIEKLQ